MFKIYQKPLDKISYSLYNIFRIHVLQRVLGIIAQLGEHLPYKQGVTGSSPVGPTFY